MKARAIICAAIFAGLVALGCSPEETVGGGCFLGNSQSCGCPGGQGGIQLCDLDQSGWRDCVCPYTPFNSPPVTINGLVWEVKTNRGSLEQADTGCQGMDAGQWRLPSREEFMELLGGTAACDATELDGVAHYQCPACATDQPCAQLEAVIYWTGTQADNGASYVVDLSSGYITTQMSSVDGSQQLWYTCVTTP